MKRVKARSEEELIDKEIFYNEQCKRLGLRWEDPERNCSIYRGLYHKTKEKLERASFYLPFIYDVTKSYERQALSFLPYFESGYLTHVESHMHARGMWQFLASTGRIFGLRVDRIIDERESPYLATHAAMKYFAKADSIFPNQILSQVLSYNIGFRSRYYRLLKNHSQLTMLPKIGFAPRHYVPSLLAAGVVFDNWSKIADDMEFPDSQKLIVYKIPKAMSATDLKKQLIFSPETINLYNPQFIQSFWTSKAILPEELPTLPSSGRHSAHQSLAPKPIWCQSGYLQADHGSANEQG